MKIGQDCLTPAPVFLPVAYFIPNGCHCAACGCDHRVATGEQTVPLNCILRTREVAQVPVKKPLAWTRTRVGIVVD
jgi:hypothetical protein